MPLRTLVLIVASVAAVRAQVTQDRLLNAAKEPENWLTYGGGFGGQRYSTLSQITPGNVKDLALQWAFQQRSTEKFEATPIVVDGVMYLTQAPNDIVAMDAATGEVKWIYSYSPSREARPCCGRVNRGLAIAGNTLYMVTIDAHIVAVDARDGKLVWDHEVAKPNAGYAMTHAPLVIKDKVIAGVAGAEFGIRGFIAAFDAATGKEAWRFYTIPGKGEPGNETWAGDSWMHGGASVWVTGSYDPETNLTFWGVGNPGPDYNSDKRGGDNLYSDCVVALDADTGKLKWYFQFTPHDDFDYDSTQVPVLANVNWQGQERKVMLWGNRNGFFYALDRTTGKYLRGTPFVKVTWTKGLDEAGRPMRINGVAPSAEGTEIYPSQSGGTNWFSPSFSPHTGLFYVNAWEGVHATFNKTDVEFQEGERFTGGAPKPTRPGLRGGQVTNRREEDGYGAVRALDPVTGEKKWEFKMADVTQSGILTTVTDLLFTGGREGFFQALDARTGKMLWRVNAGGEVAMGPMTYAVNGKQYVAFSAGGSLFVYGLR